MAVYNNRIVINSGNTFTLDTGDIVHNTTTVAGHGAGINNAGLLIADGATFYANSTTDTTTYGGGALYNSGTATLTNVLFDSNHAKHTGGSIQNVAGNVTVTGSTFTHNNSANCALYNTNGGYMTIKDCIFNGESPRAIYSDGDTVVTIIDGCQFLTSHDGILNENSTIILRGNNVINANFQNTGSRNKYWYLEGATFTFASQEASVSLPVLLTERNDGLQALVFDNKYTVSFYSSQTAFDTVAITISDNALASAQLSGTLNLATNLTVTNPTYYVDDQAVVLGSTFSKGDGSYVLTHSNGVLNLTATQETFPVTVVNTKSAANYSDGLTSLSEAISRTSVGGTVTFDASINGQRLEPETISIAKNLTIDGNGREQTLLQNNISVGSATTVSINNVHNLGARFDNNSGGVLNVSSVTIQNASGSSIGQAILNNYNSVLTVTGSTFGGNVTSASFGGGIANYNSGNNTATITDSLFINNRSQHCGGHGGNKPCIYKGSAP